MPSLLLYLVFFLSGISGLAYQVVWVRQFGHVFGNTIHSASLVIAIFMLGLGAGSYGLGAWADRRYARGPSTMLRAYGLVELVIAALGLTVSLVLPRLGAIVASLSSYAPGPDGWQTLTAGSYVARAVVALGLLGPITVLMGGTLTLLIRYLVRADLAVSGSRVALLYGINTVGAAAGAFLTDFALAPAVGLFGTQLLAVALNVVAGVGALWLATRADSATGLAGGQGRASAAAAAPARVSATGAATAVRPEAPSGTPVLGSTAVALALAGFAAMGMEILWLRHLTLLLGGFRAVFSLMMAVLLIGLGAGAFLGGWLDRRLQRPAVALMLVQALFVAAALAGLALADSRVLSASVLSLSAALITASPSSRALIETWFNLRPMLLEVGLPALIGGCAFPLGNAIVQRAESAVGRRAGALYGANTVGAVCGSLLTGYVLLPLLGMQGAALVLAATGAAALAPLAMADRALTRADGSAGLPRLTWLVPAAAGVVVLAVVGWLLLPADHVVSHAIQPQMPGERVIAMSEGSTELIGVVEAEGRGRGLMTNGHAMSSTAVLDQRYMRALAHIPLLAMSRPERVLVIGFGVGNTTQASTLHPSVSRVDVADLSRHVLDQADYFEEANHGVLANPKVSVYVNDGRQHLQMSPESTYDLITLEPPPIAHAGVAALYSREFYTLARSRLRPGGYVSQWLPGESSLAMVRAFIDVFPNAVLLSGAQAELLLLGTTGSSIEIDPERLQAQLEAMPEVKQDLERLDLSTPRDIVGTFVGSAETMRRAAAETTATTDDRPVQEYGVISMLASGFLGVPGSLFDLPAVGAWCPRCYDGGRVAPIVRDLDLYLGVLGQAYAAPVADARLAFGRVTSTRVMGSRYLAAVAPDSAYVHNAIGLSLAREGRAADAARAFETALQRTPGYAPARQNLAQLRYDDAVPLMAARRYPDAVEVLEQVVALDPSDAEAHNDLGVALASLGREDDAIGHFRQALTLQPGFIEAQRNLAAALRRTR